MGGRGYSVRTGIYEGIPMYVGEKLLSKLSFRWRKKRRPRRARTSNDSQNLFVTVPFKRSAYFPMLFQIIVRLKLEIPDCDSSVLMQK